MIHVEDEGVVFEDTATSDGTTAIDISTNLTLTITFQAPDGTQTAKAATLSGAGTDGKYRYVSTDGDLDQAGEWKWQGYVEIDASNDFHGEIHEFYVYPNL